MFIIDAHRQLMVLVSANYADDNQCDGSSGRTIHGRIIVVGKLC